VRRKSIRNHFNAYLLSLFSDASSEEGDSSSGRAGSSVRPAEEYLEEEESDGKTVKPSQQQRRWRSDQSLPEDEANASTSIPWQLTRLLYEFFMF